MHGAPLSWRVAIASGSALGLLVVGIVASRLPSGNAVIPRSPHQTPSSRHLTSATPASLAGDALYLPNSAVAGAVVVSTPTFTQTSPPTAEARQRTPSPTSTTAPRSSPAPTSPPRSAAHPPAPSTHSATTARAPDAPIATPTFTQQQFAVTATAYIQEHPPTGTTAVPTTAAGH